MDTEVENVKVLDQSEAAEQAAYDEARGVAQEQKIEQQSEEQIATETPQTELEAEIAKDELPELRSQVEKMADVFKRLDDVNGRYGRLSQRVEEMQQRIVAAPITAAGVVDAKELMADLREEFPELADKLEGAFSKVIAAKGGMDQGEIEKTVAERLVAERNSERAANLEEARKQITEFHPDFFAVVKKPEFATWKETLNPRLRARLEVSEDPYFVADQVDALKEWQQTKPMNQANKKRLADAVMPKGGNAPLGATQISEQEAYDKARAEARRIKK